MNQRKTPEDMLVNVKKFEKKEEKRFLWKK